MYWKSELIQKRIVLTGMAVAVVFLGLFGSAVGGDSTREGFSDYDGAALEIEVHALKQLMLLDPNLYLADVRTAEELNGPLGHIKEAIHVPLDEIQAGRWSAPASKTVVFVCRSGRRSLIAARIMAKQGSVTYSLKGGMKAWNAAGDITSPPASLKKKRQPASGDKSPSVPLQHPQEDKPGESFFEKDMGC